MRWSWPSFGLGVSVGLLAFLSTLMDREPAATPDAGRESAPAARSDTVVAAPDDPRPARRHAAESPPATEADHVLAAEPQDDVSARRRDAASDAPVEVKTAAFVVDGGVGNLSLAQEVRTTFVGVVLPYVSPSPVNAAASQSLARAKAAADRIAAAGVAPDVDALLRSNDDGDREAAIGAAMRSDPPQVARLLRVARDVKTGGSLRSTALLAAIEAAPQDRDVASAVFDLTGDADVGVRRTAIELLARLGGAGADRAVALLRAGEFDDRLVDPLAETVAASDRALGFLLADPAPEAAFAVLRSIAATQPADAAARVRLLDRLPEAVRPLLGTTEILDHGHGLEAFNPVASAGHVSFLRSVAVDTSLPTILRLAAVDAAVGSSACASGRAALLAATLSDGRSPVELLRAVLQRVPTEDVADGGVKAAIRALADSHPNAWLREEARATLQASPPPGADGGLRIVSGVYGKDGHTVDVTQTLGSMVVGGRLVVEAGNALAGDPLVGVVKELAVTYEWKGERRTRTINEYEALTLP